MGRKENLANARNIFFEIMMKISNDKKEWKEFLKFSSKFYKYSFTENLLMYAQNKDVTMCATLEEWNSIGRWVKPKSQSLKILKDVENDTYLEYVFDVKDTYARSDIPNAYTDEKLNIFKWNANETIDILKEYLNYENVETLRDIISIYVADEIDNAGLLNGLIEDEENIVLKPEFMELLVKNTMFQISTRCGISVENEDKFFTEYEQIANPMAINILGNCVNHCSEDLLRIVEFKVKQNKKEEQNYGTREIWSNIEEESKGIVSSEIQRVDDRYNFDGEIRGKGTRNFETEGDNRTTSERTEPGTSNSRIYSDGEVQSNDRESSGGIATTNVGGENLENNIEQSQEVDTSTSFFEPVVSQELVNKILEQGGVTENSTDRIKEILGSNLSTKEESVDIDVGVKKTGFKETQSKDTIYYDFSDIINKSNVSLDNFTWKDTLPTNALTANKIYTGTWNEELEYSVWYKTNLNDEYVMLVDGLNSTINNEVKFTDIGFREGEFVTDFEFRFSTVKSGFREIEKPRLYCDMKDNSGNGFVFTNHTMVSGNYEDKYVEDKDDWTTITYYKDIKINEKLPKTGF